jgi:hypothetical protein
MKPLRRFAAVAPTLALVLCGRVTEAHSGPPYPIVTDQVTGPYRVSLWTDPDATDDGSAAGRFWVMLGPAPKEVPAATRVSVTIQPADRSGKALTGDALPIGSDVGRRFVALLMDHEGPYRAIVTIDGPLGRAEVQAPVDATYDLRPRRALLGLFLLPFILIGFVWIKLFLKRR